MITLDSTLIFVQQGVRLTNFISYKTRYYIETHFGFVQSIISPIQCWEYHKGKNLYIKFHWNVKAKYNRKSWDPKGVPYLGIDIPGAAL